MFSLPNLFACAPFTSTVNPHHKRASAESSAWVNSYNFFVDNKRAHFIRSNIELLIAHAYPLASFEDFRTICDFANVLFVLDEISDEQDGPDALATAETCLKALNGEKCEQSDSPLYKFVTEFNARLNAKDLPGFRRRFMKSQSSYVYAFTREAELRVRGEVLNLDDYIRIRRENAAIRPCFDLMEWGLGFSLPDEVFEDEAFQRVYWAGIDMVCWANDLYSYNMEQSLGLAGNNVITVLMKANGMTLQEAVNHVGIVFESLMDTYMKNKALVRSFGPEHDANIQAYMQNVGYWAVGNLEWSFKSQRYFGSAHEEVRRTGVVKIAPQRVLTAAA